MKPTKTYKNYPGKMTVGSNDKERIHKRDSGMFFGRKADEKDTRIRSQNSN